jgi:hypothetical protein
LRSFRSETSDAMVLTVTWYHRAAPGARQALFEHSIDVNSSVLAYSTGVSEGALLTGLYEVVASLGNHQVSSPWIVRDEIGAGLQLQEDSLTSARPDRRALASTSDAEGAPPAPGESGSTPWHDEDPPATDEPDESGVCRVAVAGDALLLFVMALASERACTPDVYTAVVLAGRARGAEAVILGRGDWHVDVMFHPCELPGGSDLPGTVIELGGWGLPNGDERNAFVELKDLGFDPLVQLPLDSLPRLQGQPRSDDQLRGRSHAAPARARAALSRSSGPFGGGSPG